MVHHHPISFFLPSLANITATEDALLSAINARTSFPEFVLFDTEGLRGEVWQLGIPFPTPSSNDITLHVIVGQCLMLPVVKQILMNPRVTKVVWDGTQDCKHMWNNYKMEMKGMLDLQKVGCMSTSCASGALKEAALTLAGEPKTTFDVVAFDWTTPLHNTSDAYEYARREPLTLLTCTKRLLTTCSPERRIFPLCLTPKSTPLASQLRRIMDVGTKPESIRNVRVLWSHFFRILPQTLVTYIYNP